jgi:hypothetical protein
VTVVVQTDAVAGIVTDTVTTSTVYYYADDDQTETVWATVTTVPTVSTTMVYEIHESDELMYETVTVAVAIGEFEAKTAVYVTVY